MIIMIIITLTLQMLVLSYLLTICWVLVTTVFALPAALLILLLYQENDKDVRCINLSHYGKKYEPHHEKTNNVVSEQARHKPGCTSTEDS